MASKKTALFQGTVAQLAGNLTVNGVAVGQPEISMLTRLFKGKFCKPVGEIRQPGKGRPATVYQFFDNATLSVGLVEGASVEDVDVKDFAAAASPTGAGVLVEA